MGEFNSDDHYIYYCGQESHRINRVAPTPLNVCHFEKLGFFTNLHTPKPPLLQPSVGCVKSLFAFSKESIQIRSVVQSCLTLCDPMNRSTTGLPVHHQLPEFTETHVHRVSDAIQPSHPLSSPSPPAPNPSQH